MNIFLTDKARQEFLQCVDRLYYGRSQSIRYTDLLVEIAEYKRDFNSLPASLEDLRMRPIQTIEIKDNALVIKSEDR